MIFVLAVSMIGVFISAFSHASLFLMKNKLNFNDKLQQYNWILVGGDVLLMKKKKLSDSFSLYSHSKLEVRAENNGEV